MEPDQLQLLAATSLSLLITTIQQALAQESSPITEQSTQVEQVYFGSMHLNPANTHSLVDQLTKSSLPSTQPRSAQQIQPPSNLAVVLYLQLLQLHLHQAVKDSLKNLLSKSNRLSNKNNQIVK